MRQTLAAFSREWQQALLSFRTCPPLCELKAFRDLYVCDSRFRDELSSDFHSTLRLQFPLLTVADVASLLPSSLAKSLKLDSGPSDLNSHFLQIFGLEQRYRKFLKSLQPFSPSWRDWRLSQINRLGRDDQSFRCTQITHIPFAIELTEGCSGACRFCGLSAPPLIKNYHRFEQNAPLFKTILDEMLSSAGLSAVSGCLYWATDPFDHPDYESYAQLFRDVIGLWPITTTALAEGQLQRLKTFAMARADGRDRPWGLRCSLRSKSAFNTLFKHLTHAERARLVLIPQYEEALSTQAVAGRSYQITDESEQPFLGGTIACVSGFLVSLPRQSMSLITPCIAEPKHPNGYRTLHTTSFSRPSFKSQFDVLIRQLPCPSIDLDTALMLTIDASQFRLYSCDGCPDLLDKMIGPPFTLQSLFSLLPDDVNVDKVLQCSLIMVQSGALNVVRT